MIVLDLILELLGNIMIVENILVSNSLIYIYIGCSFLMNCL